MRIVTLARPFCVGALVVTSSIALNSTYPASNPAAASEMAPCTTTARPGDDLAATLEALPNGSTLCLEDGIYRVPSPLRPKENTTIRGSRQARLSGAIPVDRWRPAADGLWYADGFLPGDYTDYAPCEDETANLCNKRERLFVGERKLQPVRQLSDVKRGAYYADYARNRIWVSGYSSRNVYEIARAEAAIQSNAPRVTLEGFTVERFATTPQRAAVMAEGNAWVVRGLRVQHNHAKGIGVNRGAGVLLERNVVERNGQLGIGAWLASELQVKGNQVTGNNTDGFWRHDWESGGIKLFESSGSISRNTVSSNNGIGVWGDYEANGVTIANNLIDGNASDGIRFEISRGATIRGNRITNNGHGIGRGLNNGSPWVTAGLVLSTSERVEVTGNHLAGNKHTVSIQNRDRGQGKNGPFVARDILLQRNTFQLRTLEHSMIAVVGAWPSLSESTVTFRDNTYLWASNNEYPFEVPGGWMTRAMWAAAGMS
ncbi:right-handed parallel beta-helix repeat-containing protein [Mobilicoccus sp.]|uniref:right-handed parallel beta-helix repeat-containing protein n=1 Tax=Mobilicoccus sp. TaxID=2034349 RepID=UPI0028AE4FC7|nr:right-handed parallel beta-helix repeat-containing protein [Mobilicoccus sp.]